MKLEEQVTSLELSKQLKTLGVKQESLWKWRLAGNLGWQVERHPSSITLDGEYSAFTVAELGEMLPMKTQSWKYESENKENGWVCENSVVEKSFEAETEANARASMLVYLLENKIRKPCKKLNHKKKAGRRSVKIVRV